MERHLPIRVEISRSMAGYFRGQGVFVPPYRQVTFDKIFYQDDDGGIACGIFSPKSKEALVVSFTNLKIPYNHPLEKEIRAYQ